jgi:cyclophilin family peptidyl-prolyl cis-trans isomerase
MTAFHLSALARRDYFRGQRFHRVVPAFVVQGGDPRGDGSGGPGVAIRDELNRLRYLRGAVGMALSGPDTGGSQFFLTLAPQPHLDGHYTVFGRVIRGAAVMDAIAQGDALRTISSLPQ